MLGTPVPAAHPYLALGVPRAAARDGIEHGMTPPNPVNKNSFTVSHRERRKCRIDELPRDLHEALDCLEADAVVREALGEHIYERLLEAKRSEWMEYSAVVTKWEIDKYLGQY